MLVNALGLDTQLPFPEEIRGISIFDDTDSSAWYAPYLSAAKAFNLLEVTNGNFNPTGGMNRAGISENIFRTLVVKENEFDGYDDLDRDAFLYFKGLGDLVGVQTIELDEEELNEFEEALNNMTEEELEAAFSLVGGDSDDEAATDDSVSAVKTFQMTARQWEFEPATITVNVGDTVHLNIVSEDVTHGFSIAAFDVAETLTEGATTEVEFVADQAGTYTFFCSVFCGSGHAEMEGTLVVE